MESLQLLCSLRCLLVNMTQTELIAPTTLVVTSRHGPHTKHTVSNSNPIAACVFVAAGTCLTSRYPETVVVYRVTT
jgi:hypothetical protein